MFEQRIALVCAGILSLSVFALGDVTEDPVNKKSGVLTQTEISTPGVFEPPQSAELQKITHSALRDELLTMAHRDQVARSAGT